LECLNHTKDSETQRERGREGERNLIARAIKRERRQEGRSRGHKKTRTCTRVRNLDSDEVATISAR
jgi:hypothetical protein